jgi:hypothetical protein
MKHFYALVFPLFFLCGTGSAQFLASNGMGPAPLSGESASPAPESSESPEWQRDQDQVNGHISNSKLARMRDVSDAIISYFHDSCITEGEFSPTWHGEYFPDNRGSGKDMKFGIQCNFSDNKANLTIMANTMHSLLLDPLIVNNQEFLAIRPSTGTDKDHPYFEYNVPADEATANGSPDTAVLHYRVWLVATAGQLPYIPVSRAEYLKEARQELTAAKNAIIATMKDNIPVRSAAIQAADKKAALEQLAALYSGMDLQVRTNMFLARFKTDEDYQKENIDKGTAGLDSSIALMDRLQYRSTGLDLGKPAIVSLPAAGFRGFEDGHDGKMLIRVNPVYASGEGNDKAPRFLLVNWQFNPSEPMAGGIDRQIRERFDGQKLKAVLQAL